MLENIGIERWLALTVESNIRYGEDGEERESNREGLMPLWAIKMYLRSTNHGYANRRMCIHRVVVLGCVL